MTVDDYKRGAMEMKREGEKCTLLYQSERPDNVTVQKDIKG